MAQELNLVDETGQPLKLNLVNENGSRLDIGSIMEGNQKTPGRVALEAADYVNTSPTLGIPTRPGLKTSAGGYILNPANPNAKKNGIVTALDTTTGKSYRINIDPNTPASIPDLIEGHIRNLPENQQSIIDKIKNSRLTLPAPVMGAKPFDTGLTFGNLAEGFKDVLPSPRNVFRTVGAGFGGTAGLAGGIPTGPGAILTAAAGGAGGAVAGDAAYNTVQALVNRYTDQGNKTVDQLGQILGKPDPTLAGQFKGYAGAAGQGALQEGSGKLLAPALAKLSKSLAERQVGLILGPSTKANNIAVDDVASELATKLPPSATTGTLLTKLKGQVDTLGPAVDQAYTAATQNGLQVPAAPILKALNDVKSSYMLRGNPIAGAEPIITTLDEAINQIGNNPNLTPQEYRQIKGVWDNIINWSRNSQARVPQAEEAFTTGANAIRNALHTASPSLEQADTSFSLMKTAYDALKAKTESHLARPLGSGFLNKGTAVAPAIGGTIGTILGHAVGAPVEGAALGSGAAESLYQLMNTTAYRTMSLSLKSQVQDLVKKGLTQKAIGLILSQGAVSAPEGVRKLMTPDNIPTTLKK